MNRDTIVRVRVAVEGTVQGVGFRPFVHRLAVRHGLAGWVRNGMAGVEIAVVRVTDEPIAGCGGDAGMTMPDDDGGVIVPQALLDDVLHFAELAEQAEGEIRRALDAGEDRESVDRRIDRFAALKSARNK